MRALPGGRFEAVNARLRDVISTAFVMEPFQKIEGPQRLLDSRFDISAASSEKVDLPDRPRPGPFHIALQGLLTARFGLKAHVEPRPMTGYVLSLARQDGRLGPQLRPSALDCRALRAARMPDPVDEEGQSRCAVTARSATNGVIGTRVRAGSHTIANLATLLQRSLVAPVQDKTGLDALFDIDLTYGWFPGLAVPQSADNRAPDLATAMREQLGIRLEAKQILVDALIIEHVEEPTEN